MSEFVVADWKDIDGLIESFEEALKEFGIHMYQDPTLEGSDTYGFLLSSVEMTDEEIAGESEEFWGPWEEEDGEADNRGLDQIGEDIDAAISGFDREVYDILNGFDGEEKVQDLDYMENILMNWLENAGVDRSDLQDEEVSKYISQAIDKAVAANKDL